MLPNLYKQCWSFFIYFLVKQCWPFLINNNITIIYNIFFFFVLSLIIHDVHELKSARFIFLIYYISLLLHV